MTAAIHGLRAAFGFLTRIPISTPTVVMANAAPWFPFIGLLIGVAQGAVYFGLSQLLPALPAAVLSVAAAALITGAFHHDGLADMADAFGGGWDIDQRLAIMKDSRLGTYGTSALILAFATEISTLSTLEPVDGFRALVAAHTLSRAMAVGAMVRAPLARPTGELDPDPGADGARNAPGLGAAYAADLRIGLAAVSVAFGLLVTFLAFFDPWVAWPAIVLAAATQFAVVGLAKRKIGGITGDVLGAVQQMSALAVLVVAAAAAN